MLFTLSVVQQEGHPFQAVLFSGWWPFSGTQEPRSCMAFWPNAQPQWICGMCIQWWVGGCTVWWPKFTRIVSVEWCRGRGGIEGLCALLIRLAMPNRAPAIELVIRQPWHDYPSMISLPAIRQHGRLWKTNVHTLAGQPTCPPAWVPVTNCKATINFTNCCMSQFKEDRGKPSVSTQEINPIRCLL